MTKQIAIIWMMSLLGAFVLNKPEIFIAAVVGTLFVSFVEWQRIKNENK